MNARNLLLAALTGFAGFMLATVAVTELLAARIEFSIFVGLPAGILAGLLVTWFVYAKLSGPGADERRTGTAIVAAAVGFVVTMALATSFELGVVIAMVAGLLVGATAAVVSYQQGVTI